MTNKPSESLKIRRKVYNLITSNKFEGSILLVIQLNMVQMAISYEGASENVDYYMNLTNYIFTAIFIVEALLKFFVFGWAYFSTNWNRFDFFVVISSIIDIILTT